MNLHDNKDVFEAAIQLASTPKDEGGLIHYSMSSVIFLKKKVVHNYENIVLWTDI